MNDLWGSQKKVLGGIALGIIGASTTLFVAYQFFSEANYQGVFSDRISLALICNALAALALLAGIGAVSNRRFLTEAINPLLTKEDERTRVHLRYLGNTVEQFLLFSAGSLALSVLVPTSYLAIIPALTLNFLLGRALFWIGYIKHPLYRAAGMAMSAYPNALMLLYVAWKIFS